MSEDIFRIAVTIAVVVAVIAFVAQAMFALGIYRAVRKMQERAEPLADRIEPVIARLGPAVEQIRNLAERAGPVVDKLGPFVDKAGRTVERIGPMLDKAGATMDKAGVTMEKAGKTIDAGRDLVETNRGRVDEIASEALSIARTGREHVERIGAIIQDAGDRASARIEQIDESLDATVEQVGQVGENVKRAAQRPVREISGVAAGVAAVISTLVRGRKYPVDHATLDEEMFI